MKGLDLVATGERDPYVAYSYSYPHKSAYGPLAPPAALEPVWRAERRDALFLYVHIPFCEMRCGFCNLFTRAQASAEQVDAYLGALKRQADVMGPILGEFAVARFALGGGTPTFLEPRQLELVFDCVEREFRVDLGTIPTSVETSPKTATPDRLAVLRERGVERVSIGVQSFDDREAHALGRPQCSREVHVALDRLRDFPSLNIDLIYGQPNQTIASWLDSVGAALRHGPEEIFLYPLYVRPMTGLGRQGQVQRASADRMRQLYRAGRDLLLAEGYEQISMRCFRGSHVPRETGPSYCCQSDAMAGLGCGARSYTDGLHYSSRFAVESSGVQSILEEWIAQPADAFRCASWGIRLSDEDRRRRHVIQSLLTREGLDEVFFSDRFGEPLGVLFPQLTAWAAEGLVDQSAGRWRLTELGLELSDHLGPALYSAASQSALERFGDR
jgi:oxygen-independent coproporphyrinogen-3 oxidase